jgi:hypothetical protein
MTPPEMADGLTTAQHGHVVRSSRIALGWQWLRTKGPLQSLYMPVGYAVLVAGMGGFVSYEEHLGWMRIVGSTLLGSLIGAGFGIAVASLFWAAISLTDKLERPLALLFRKITPLLGGLAILMLAAAAVWMLLGIVGLLKIGWKAL